MSVARPQAIEPDPQFCKGPSVKAAAFHQGWEAGVQHSVMYCVTFGFELRKSDMVLHGAVE